MRFEIKIDHSIDIDEPVLFAFLYTKSQEYYLDGGKEGVYNCAFVVSKDAMQLINTIEMAVNACINRYLMEKKDNEF